MRSPDGTLAIDPVVNGRLLTNSLYAAQVAKDAIADWFRDRFGERPSVDRHQPDVRVNLHVAGEEATLYLDASGQSLHKRGYRRQTGEAPLNEVLAAGILRLAGWDGSGVLVDFLCGSGTLPIEAALIARNFAPGLLRDDFGYRRWLNFDAELERRVIDETRQLARPAGGADTAPQGFRQRSRFGGDRGGAARMLPEPAWPAISGFKSPISRISSRRPPRG